MVDFARINRERRARKAKNDKIQNWINTVNQTGKGLTTWEEEFMEKLTEQWADFGTMSPKQEEILENIYAEKTPN